MGLIDRLTSPFKKAALDEAFQSGEWLDRARQLGVVGPERPTPKSLFYDPYTLVTQTGYKDRMSALSYEILKQMADRTEVVNAVINVRLSQIGSFCQPARWKNKTGLGYQIRFKDVKRDEEIRKNKKKKAESEKRFIELEEMIWRCGYGDMYSSGEKRPFFHEFIKKFLKDSLIYDQACFEIVPDRLGRPFEWWALDAATIRIAQPNIQNFDVEDGRDVIKYVQVYQGTIRHKFTYKEMAFCVRNVDTNIRRAGYGYSELEQLINLITAYLWAEEYNKRFFSQGQMINGILNLKGQNIPTEMLEAFRRQWQALAASVTNAHKVPVVTVKDGVEFINFHSSNRDMEFSSWLEFLVKMITGVYLIDPAEINFDYRGASDSAPLFETSPEAKLKHSRDKGLRNLLNFIEEMINVHIIHPIDPELYFEFVGIDMKDEQEIVNIRASEVQAYKTLDQVREEAGLEPLGEEKGGNWVLNSVWANMQLQIMAQQQQAEAGQQGGGEQPQGNPQDSVTHTPGFEPDQQYVQAPGGGNPQPPGGAPGGGKPGG